MATNGLVVMTPSSIAYSGTSASINADGSVVFSACSSLSLNGVFTSAYDNYMVTLWQSIAGAIDFRMRLRSSGIDSSSGYTSQYLYASSTTVSAGRVVFGYFTIGGGYSGAYGGNTSYLFGPYLTQPTAHRNVAAATSTNAPIFYDYAETHSGLDAYDGITFFPQSSSTDSGKITVFGFNQ